MDRNDIIKNIESDLLKDNQEKAQVIIKRIIDHKWIAENAKR